MRQKQKDILASYINIKTVKSSDSSYNMEVISVTQDGKQMPPIVDQ